MKVMCFEANIERFIPKYGDTRFRLNSCSWIKATKTPRKSRMIIDGHIVRRLRRIGNEPARFKARASRDQRRMSFSPTMSLALSINASRSFFGMRTRSPILLNFLGMVMPIMLLIYSQKPQKSSQNPAPPLDLFFGVGHGYFLWFITTQFFFCGIIGPLTFFTSTTLFTATPAFHFFL